MKKSNRQLIRGTNWALAGLLSLLGFSACGNQVDEYGTPYAEYKVSGQVTDEQGRPVEGVKMELGNVQGDTTVVHAAPTRTDRDGKYSVETHWPGKMVLIASDIDGAANGSLENDTIPVTFESKDFYKPGDGGWFQGAAKKEVNVKLKSKK